MVGLLVLSGVVGKFNPAQPRILFAVFEKKEFCVLTIRLLPHVFLYACSDDDVFP